MDKEKNPFVSNFLINIPKQLEKRNELGKEIYKKCGNDVYEKYLERNNKIDNKILSRFFYSQKDIDNITFDQAKIDFLVKNYSCFDINNYLK